MRSKPLPTIRNRHLLAADLVFSILCVFGAFALRFELGSQFFYYLPTAFWMAGAAFLIRPVVF